MFWRTLGAFVFELFVGLRGDRRRLHSEGGEAGFTINGSAAVKGDESVKLTVTDQFNATSPFKR